MSLPSLNRCNLPPWALASRQYAEDPRPLLIQGVRDSNRFLFQALDQEPDPARRGQKFHDWLSVRFQLHHWEAQATDTARRSLKNSYVRFLRGWGVDSSSIEGAVLKSWVESRLGLTPTYHRGRIDGIESEAYQVYTADRMRGSARTSAILDQLDLLYEFAQYELARRRPGERWVTLWRGVHEEEERDVISRSGPRDLVVRLNALASFTEDREAAWEFGYAVWEVRVPLAKVFFFPGLLPSSLLKGEGEWLVIGGEYPVRRLVG